jgi:hypothetical protein
MRLARSKTATGPPTHRAYVRAAILVIALVLAGVLVVAVLNAQSDEVVDEACPRDATDRPATADELQAAFAKARSGDVIHLAPETRYRGRFVIEASGTKKEPVWVCGNSGSVLEGKSARSGNVLTIRNSAWVHVAGVVVESGKRGVVFDHSRDVSFTGGLVRRTGQEAVHLVRNTTSSVVARNVIEDTGLWRPEWGEGVYVGTSPPNLPRVNANRPDRSDKNRISDNQFRRTSAECVDVKTGTSAGVIENNTCDLSRVGRFDADQFTTRNGFVIRGNKWRVIGNELVWLDAEKNDGYIRDGIRVHVGKDRGRDNTIQNNVMGGTAVRADTDFGNSVSGNTGGPDSMRRDRL